MAAEFQSVLIVNKSHPHFKEVGRFTGKIITFPWGKDMAEVELDNCSHGTNACFVSKGDVKILAANQSGEIKEISNF